MDYLLVQNVAFNNSPPWIITSGITNDKAISPNKNFFNSFRTSISTFTISSSSPLLTSLFLDNCCSNFRFRFLYNHAHNHFVGVLMSCWQVSPCYLIGQSRGKLFSKDEFIHIVHHLFTVVHSCHISPLLLLRHPLWLLSFKNLIHAIIAYTDDERLHHHWKLN